MGNTGAAVKLKVMWNGSFPPRMWKPGRVSQSGCNCPKTQIHLLHGGFGGWSLLFLKAAPLTPAVSLVCASPCPALHLSRVPFTLRISLILNKGIKLLFQLFLPLKARLSKGANCHFSVAPAAVLAATQAAGTLF